MIHRHVTCASAAMLAMLAAFSGSAFADNFVAVRQGVNPDRLDTLDIASPGTTTILASLAGNFVRGVEMTGPDDGYYVCTDDLLGSPIGFFRLENAVSSLIGPLPFASGGDGGLCFNADQSSLYWVADPPLLGGIDNDDTLYRITLAGAVTALTTISLVGVSPLAIIDLTIHPTTGVLYGLESTSDSIITIDPATGIAQKVGTGIGVTSALVGGMDFAPDGTLYVCLNSTGDIRAINLTTGLAGPLIGALGFNCSAIASIPAADCPADIDGNNVVGVGDLLSIIGAWGPCPLPCPPACAADIAPDCSVGVADLLLVIGEWGACP